MSTEAPERPAIDPRIRARRVQVTREEGRRRLRLLVVGAGVAAVLGIAVGTVRSPVLDVDTVTIAGARQTPRAEVIEAAGLESSPQMIDLDPAKLASRIRALPWVRTARVERDWPSRVRIRITERKAVAAISAGKSWVLVDRTGRVLTRTDQVPPGLVSVSTSETLPSPGGQVGEPTAQVVAGLTDLSPAVAPLVTQVVIVRSQIELRSSAAGPVVRLGPVTDLEAKLRAVEAVVAGADLRRVKVIDVRVPSAPVLTRR